MKSSFFLFLILAFHLTLSAQEDKAERNTRGNLSISMDVTIGGLVTDYSALNSDLEVLNFSGFSENNFGMGAGGGFWFRDLVFAGTEVLYFYNMADHDGGTDKSASLSGYRIMLLGGVKIYRGERIELKALAGYGGGLYTMALTDHSRESVGAAISDPNSTIAELIGEVAEATIGADYIFKTNGTKCEEPVIRLGLRAGYQYGISSRWHSGYNNITGPEVDFSGPVLKVILGFDRYN